MKNKTLNIFKIILIINTALFVAFHTVIFVRAIEPTLYLAWMLAGVIEGFLVILAITKTRTSKALLIPLFLVSVLSSSASLVVKNEQDLNKLLNLKNLIQAEQKREDLTKRQTEEKEKAIAQLQKDIAETQAQLLVLPPKYQTKTLERERRLKDRLNDLLTERQGQGEPTQTVTAEPVLINYITALKFPLFLLIVSIVQAVSLYTAAGLKNGIWLNGILSNSEIIDNKLNDQKNQNIPLNTKHPVNQDIDLLTLTDTTTDKNSESALTNEERTLIIEKVKGLKTAGMSAIDLSKETEIPRTTLSKIFTYPTYPVSNKIFLKVKAYLEKLEN